MKEKTLYCYNCGEELELHSGSCYAEHWIYKCPKCGLVVHSPVLIWEKEKEEES